MNTFYYTYKKNVFSQNGEDGIIEELLRRLGITDGWVCEFGAWDGVHLSNTFNLIKNRGFSGVFIEGDEVKFNDLLVTQSKYPKIVPVLRYVDHTPGSDNTLDKILQDTDIPIDFDILSIDIDSFDYQVWDTVDVYKPKIVIVEINSAVHPDNKRHIHTPNVYEGTGFLPMFNLGVKKGYTFVLHTGNMFFIKNELYSKLNMESAHPLDNFRHDWIH